MVEKQVEFLEETVSCPKYRAICCDIRLSDCVKCEHHKGVVPVTEIHGVEIKDVLCGLPVNKRINRLIREVYDGGAK